MSIGDYMVNESKIPVGLLEASARQHQRLCPRQVLGLRMGLLAGRLFDLAVPRVDKRLLCIAETDGCAVDGITAAAGCTVGRRTLRIMDWGKVAATFIDVESRRAIRIVPSLHSRDAACSLLPGAESRWHAQLEAYQTLPDEILLTIQPVMLAFSLEQILSKPGHMAICERCGEEIMNQREIVRDAEILCRACAGDSYYVALIEEI